MNGDKMKIIIFICCLVVVYMLMVYFRNVVILRQLLNNFSKLHSNITKTLKIIVPLLNKNEIIWWIFGGTLLGYERHNKSYIPWDDDIDIVIVNDNNLKRRMKKFEKDIAEFDLYIKTTPFGYAIHHKKHKGYIDLFIYTKNNNKYVGNEWVRRSFPNDFFIHKETFPLKQDYFEGVMVNLPKEHITFLKRAYGNDCLESFRLTYAHNTNLFYKLVISFTKWISIKPCRTNNPSTRIRSIRISKRY